MPKQYLIQRLVTLICTAHKRGLRIEQTIAILEGVLGQLKNEAQQTMH